MGLDNSASRVVNLRGEVQIMTGEELKKARILKTLTQKQLGLMLGYNEKIAERTVQHWEYGARPIPVKHFRALSKILAIPLDKFIP
jgi:transcriptional regulator with XRE-family HTH domain